MRRLLPPVLCVILLSLLAVLSACGSAGSTTEATLAEGAAATERSFTAAELATFDGQGGRSAYVAVDGIVYDVSASVRWPEGVHGVCNLGASAGMDLSETITRAPASMRSQLEKMPVVGTLRP